MRLAPALAAVALALGALTTGPSAFAADEINIDHVQSEGGTVSMLLGVDRLPGGSNPDLDTIAVTVDGQEVDATAETVEGRLLLG